MKKILACMLSILVLFSLLPNTTHADELEGLTLEKEMRFMMERGIIKGTGGKVYPKAEVKRSDFAAFLARTLTLSKETPDFIDVNPSAAVAGEIGAIQKSGFMTGTLDGKFMPDKVITREELALTMARVLEVHNYTRTGQDIIIEDQKLFTLNGGVSAAQWLASVDLMKGGSGTQGSKSFLFKPKDTSLRDQVAAVLYRFIQLEENMTTPEPPPEKPTEPEQPNNPNVYKVASIQNGKVVETSAQYADYAAALKVLSSSNDLRVIVKNHNIIKMKTGLAFAADTKANTTDIYEDAKLTKKFTYIQEGREMKHRGSGPDYVIVEVGGKTGYVHHSDVDLVPKELITGRDFFVSENGILHHSTYNNMTKKSGSYMAGPAPAGLVEKRHYYSYDSVRYTDEAGRVQATQYQYFQFLSARMPTSYTAQQLNQVIQQLLQERQATGASRYVNATTKSKLVGLGEKLKTLETNNRVNALFMLAAAIHESDFGISEKALTCNNLFGIKAYDSSTKVCEKTFPTPEASVNSFVADYMNKNYLNPMGAYANGAVTGNKSVGANVRYASDPDWGAKIAGHLYTLDTKLGGHEYKKHTLGRIDYYNANDGINIRTSPGVSPDNVLFTYMPKLLGEESMFGYPVIIVDTLKLANGEVWYQIVNDMNPVHNGKATPEYGYILSDLVTVTSNRK
ncbi:glucosaminidase domain-containing protein [Sporosarcina sp. A2]|uniref:glucosaminidase domain-containing protein n=1 Tax=Sporosarcina sp. A2 TaxID=3393449 RepID=UPI003D7B1D4C